MNYTNVVLCSVLNGILPFGTCAVYSMLHSRLSYVAIDCFARLLMFVLYTTNKPEMVFVIANNMRSTIGVPTAYLNRC